MPANLPSPIVGAGGGGQRSPVETLLMSLAQQLMSAGVQAGVNKFMPQQQTPQERQRAGQEAYAQEQLMGMPGSQEHTALQVSAANGLGNANVATQDVTGLGALPRGASTAPERLALRLEEKRLKDEEDSKVRIRTRAIASTPENLRGVMEMLLNAKEAGADSSSINDLLPRLLPPTEAETIKLARDGAELEEIRLRMRQMRGNEVLRTEFAKRLGLPEGSTVTDGMITQWMQQTAPDKPDSPSAMAERIATSLISRTVTDLMGNANPAFSVEEALVRTEDAMKAFVPGFSLTITPENRERVTAAGILQAAVAREKQNNPRITPEELTAKLGARFSQDFPLVAGEFDVMLAEALKSNLLTGL